MLGLKTSPPPHRSGLVPRREVLSWLESSSAPVVALVAPAGYGKTTALSQFFEHADRPVAWLNLDEDDRDPKRLLSGLALALSKAGLAWDPRQPGIESGAVLTRGVARLLAQVDANAKGVLILDHVDQVRGQSSLDVIGAVMIGARDRLQVIVASRSQVGLPLGLLRARGDLLELGVEDLALSSDEIAALFAETGAGGPDEIGAVLERTEGWAAAVYLTARAIRDSGAAHHSDIHGDDRYLADYLRDELLEDTSPEMESFLLRTAVLPRLSGELCDHVLGTRGSAEILSELQDSNLLVIPLDRNRTWYRYHSLLKEYLESELHRRLPDEEPGLHERASEWFEARGSIEPAIEHAGRAGDYERVAELLGRWARSMFATGHSETLFGWLSMLEQRGVLSGHPDLAAVGALSHALIGDAGGADRMALFAYKEPTGQPRHDARLGPLSRMVRAYLAPQGVDQALIDATIAREPLQQESEWAHASLGALALATLAVEGIEAAEPIWADTVWRSESMVARPLAFVARAMRSVAAIRRNDWESAERHLGDTVREIEDHGLETHVTSCLALIAEARIAAHRGDLEASRSYLGATAPLRSQLTIALPVYSVLTLHEKAHAYIELADVAGARRVMRDAGDILAVRPRLGTLVEEHAILKETLAGLPVGTVGPSSLTGAELRLLPLLVTHLTYPQIAERLYISRHTVKTQAMSIYRKLGVSSRGEAVDRSRAIGLISA